MRHLFCDLDETLINAVELKPDGTLAETVHDADKLQSWDMGTEFRIFLRPGLGEFLTGLRGRPVSVWSAGSKEYVLDICRNIVQPGLGHSLTSLFWSAHCSQSQKETGCLKSFGWLLERIPCLANYGKPLLLDDLVENCTFQEQLSLQISPFKAAAEGAAADRELQRVLARINVSG